MPVMPRRPAPSAVEPLPEGGTEQRRLDVVDGQGVAGQQAVDEAVLDQLHEGAAGVPVEDQRRTGDPEDEAVLPLMAKQGVELVVVAAAGALPARQGAEGEGLAFGCGIRKGTAVDIDPLLPGVAAPHRHQLPLAQVPEFVDRQGPVGLADDDAVHARLPRQVPVAGGELEILGEDGGGVEVLGGHAGGGSGEKPCERCRRQGRRSKVGYAEGGEKKRHRQPFRAGRQRPVLKNL